MARRHELKVWPSYFEAIVDGRKRFELRKNERDFAVGDTLRLREFQPDNGFGGGSYTGRTTDVRVTYIAQGVFDLPLHMCVMSIEPEPQTGVPSVR